MCELEERLCDSWVLLVAQAACQGACRNVRSAPELAAGWVALMRGTSSPPVSYLRTCVLCISC